MNTVTYTLSDMYDLRNRLIGRYNTIVEDIEKVTQQPTNRIVPTLHDPTLEFVDAHDPNIDTVTAGKVLAECKVNLWYFFRECLRVPADGLSHVEKLSLELESLTDAVEALREEYRSLHKEHKLYSSGREAKIIERASEILGPA